MKNPTAEGIGGRAVGQLQNATTRTATIPDAPRPAIHYHKGRYGYEVRIPLELSDLREGLRAMAPDLSHRLGVRIFDVWQFAEIVARAERRGVDVLELDPFGHGRG
jgi:hypothetical protein